MERTSVAIESQTIKVRLNFSIRKRGGRKLVVAPDGAKMVADLASGYVDNTMVKAIARAFRWRDFLETGRYHTLREIATAEKINEAYVGRVLRLTLLAPEIIEAILAGQQPVDLQLDKLLKKFPIIWEEQRHLLTR